MDATAEAVHIVAADDYFHPHEFDLYWCESAAFSFDVPELSLTGKLGMWNRPDMRQSTACVVLFEPTRHEIYDCLHYNMDWWMAMPDGTEGTDAVLPNGYTVELIEPLTKYRLTYEHPEVRFDLTWDAVTEPHDLKLQTGQKEVSVGRRHFEQIGRVHGRLEIPGQPTVDVDCYSLRDKSWGPRHHLGHVPNVDGTWAVASDGSSFHLLTINVDDEGLEGDLVGGFLRRDGVTADLAHARRTVVAREGFHTIEYEIAGTDTLGRPLSALCRNHNALRWVQFPRQYVCWSQMSCELDGKPAWGNDQEAFNAETARRMFRR